MCRWIRYSIYAVSLRWDPGLYIMVKLASKHPVAGNWWRHWHGTVWQFLLAGYIRTFSCITVSVQLCSVKLNKEESWHKEVIIKNCKLRFNLSIFISIVQCILMMWMPVLFNYKSNKSYMIHRNSSLRWSSFQTVPKSL